MHLLSLSDFNLGKRNNIPWSNKVIYVHLGKFLGIRVMVKLISSVNILCTYSSKNVDYTRYHLKPQERKYVS